MKKCRMSARAYFSITPEDALERRFEVAASVDVIGAAVDDLSHRPAPGRLVVLPVDQPPDGLERGFVRLAPHVRGNIDARRLVRHGLEQPVVAPPPALTDLLKGRLPVDRAVAEGQHFQRPRPVHQHAEIILRRRRLACRSGGGGSQRGGQQQRPQRSAQRSSTRRCGSSRLSLTRTRKVTASLPSTMR